MTTVKTSVQALNGLLQRLGPTAHRCGAGEALGVDSAQIYSGLCSLMHNEAATQQHTVTSSIFISSSIFICNAWRHMVTHSDFHTSIIVADWVEISHFCLTSWAN